ncbi:alpha/beta hydrolase [Flammeovirga sp. SJP92]|uniref:alpha/beta hydrolase n=1 Tax=Flammeovirga sp. SJP92 TaxID=1775430 RepID=UPI0007885805|nr:alpha/beta fold hydrolase [Flammeovirga sp. SJP92]KXX69188.1 alpha/beta hydrolase [Flammeovirga sp. SJP92]
MFGKMIAKNLVMAGEAAPLFDNPSNYNLQYENVSFQASDGVNLKGWLIKGDDDKVIIQSHFGLYCCRAGYTNDIKRIAKGYPTDVKFLRQAKYLNDAGYSVLMFDMRNHGESDPAMDGFASYGPEEAKDIIASVDFISNHSVYKNANIGLFSICMGQGASVSAYGREDGLKNYSNIKCMISVQPLDYAHFIDKMKLPGFLLKRADRFIKKNTDFDYINNTWRPYVKDVTVPTLIIQNKNDGFLDKDFVDGVYNDLQVEKEMMWIEIPDKKNQGFNRMAAYDWLGTHSEPVLKWFNKYM